MRYIEQLLRVPVSGDADVCVCGGGVAGIAAALSARRTGARVTLIEREYMLGGLATAGLIAMYLPLDDGRGAQVSFGICEELIRLAIARGTRSDLSLWLTPHDREARAAGPRYNAGYNPWLFAIDAERLLLREGVTILYGTSVCDAVVESEKITALVVENKSGRSAISVRAVVDATGDADVCFLSGAKCETFGQGNVLAGWYLEDGGKGLSIRPIGAADIPDKHKTGAEEKPLIARRFGGLDAGELSEMVCLSHEKTLADIERRRADNPGFEPSAITVIPQIRMTRRLAGRSTPGDETDHINFPDGVGLYGNWRRPGAYQLRLSMLHGEEIGNLLAAGRCLSARDDLWELTRVIPVCAVSGEAAGLAAAMGGDVRALDPERVRKALRARGVPCDF